MRMLSLSRVGRRTSLASTMASHVSIGRSERVRWRCDEVIKPCLACISLFVVCSIGPSSADAQTRLTARYTVSLASVGIGEGQWVVVVANDSYSTQASGHYFGVWRLLLGSNLNANGQGTLRQSGLAPSGYSANFSLDTELERVQITYRGEGVSELETRPPLAALRDRIAITAAHLRGAVDPLTAVLIAVPRGDPTSAASCQRTLAVFDGSQRFDLALSFKRKEDTLTVEGYHGPVLVCAMTYRPIAGYSPTDHVINYFESNKNMEIWFAPIGNSHLLGIIRISIPTMLGTAVLQATQFETSLR